MPCEDHCQILKWPLLSTRSSYFSLVECYKIVFGSSHLDFYDYFEFAKATSTTANHSYKLYVQSTRLNCSKRSFFMKIVIEWNSLPKNVVEASSFELFKIKLSSFFNL